MISNKKKKKFKRIYKYHDGPFEVMVLCENGKWNKSKVIGLSMSGYLIFSGWFISGCFKVKDYKTITKYNKKKMYLLPEHNGPKVPVVDDVHKYINLNY